MYVVVAVAVAICLVFLHWATEFSGRPPNGKMRGFASRGNTMGVIVFIYLSLYIYIYIYMGG